ncbi:hypothetical protein KCP77_23310 [Salmonella enterica subsp. enterica]|nr:hypothetical protein KCP77_23310 [Salmonella enterica subsp. enterica]
MPGALVRFSRRPRSSAVTKAAMTVAVFQIQSGRASRRSRRRAAMNGNNSNSSAWRICDFSPQTDGDLRQHGAVRYDGVQSEA